jgi:hypothetical protein
VGEFKLPEKRSKGLLVELFERVSKFLQGHRTSP